MNTTTWFLDTRAIGGRVLAAFCEQLTTDNWLLIRYTRSNRHGNDCGAIRMTDDSTIDLLLTNLNHPDLNERLDAIAQLGQRRSLRAVKPLLIAHMRRQEPEKSAIIDAFRAMGEHVLPPLNTIFLRDVNPFLQADAAFVLGELGHRHSIRVLARGIQMPHELVRAMSVTALGKFDDDSVYGPLLQALRDETPSVNIEAGIILGQRGDVRAVDVLIRALEQSLIHPRNRYLVILALGKTADPRAAEVLADALADPHVENRAAAAEGLGYIHDVRVIPVLQDALNDPDPMVHDAALAALRRLGHET